MMKSKDRPLIFRLTCIAFLATVMLFTSNSFAGSTSKSEAVFCSVAQWFSKNKVRYATSSVSTAMGIARGAAAAMEVITVNTKMTTIPPYLANNQKALLKTLSTYKPMKAFAMAYRYSFEYMEKMNKTIKQLAAHPNTLLSDPGKAALVWKRRHKILRNVGMAYDSLLTVPVASIYSIQQFVCKWSKTKANLCKLSYNQCGGGHHSDDSILIDGETGEVTSSGDVVNGCSTSPLYSYAVSQEGTMGTMKRDLGKLKVFTDKYAGPLGKFSKAIKPLLSPMKEANKVLGTVAKIMKVTNTITKLLTKAMDQQICFLVPTVVKKQVCKKIKVAGKKKKVCKKVKVPGTKKNCSTVKRTMEKFNKASKPLQKVMDVPLKKILNPIVKKVVSKLPSIPGQGKLKQAFRALSQIAPLFDSLSKDFANIKNLPFKSYATQSNQMLSKLKSIPDPKK